MPVLCLALAVGTLGGTLAGGLAGWWLARRSPAPTSPPEYIDLGPDLEQQIGRAASAWATSHQRPEAASLVADRLRLAYALSRGRQRQGRRRRWPW